MSKVPSRGYCTSCKKLSHGVANCKGGKCSCKCRNMTTSELDELHKKYHDDIEFTYSKESDEAFEKIMFGWRKEQQEKKPNVPEVIPQ